MNVALKEERELVVLRDDSVESPVSFLFFFLFPFFPVPYPSPEYRLHGHCANPAGGGSTIEQGLPCRVTGLPFLSTGLIGVVVTPGTMSLVCCYWYNGIGVPIEHS